jgi:ubiquinone biosynthesis protein
MPGQTGPPSPLLDGRARLRARRLGRLAWVTARRGAAVARRAARGERPLSAVGAHQARLAFQDLGPTFVKMGQVISSSPGTFPPALVEEFAHCQDRVPPEPWWAVDATIAEELGDRRARFRSIDRRPLAAASIAQVHGGSLSDGSEVVLKIQRRHLGEVLGQDLRVMMAGARLAGRLFPSLASINPVGVVADFAHSLGEELDFTIEAGHMERIARILDTWPVRVPAVHWDIGTDKVLVMERLSGTKVSETDRLDELGIDKVALADTILGSLLTCALGHGVFHGDGHAGNMLVEDDGTLVLLDFGIVGHLDLPTRQTIARLIAAFVERRFDVVAECVIALARVSHVDVDAAVADLEAISASYLDRPWGQVPVARLLVELIRSANRHGVVLPTDLVLLFKQILYLDGLGRTLNPQFDLFLDGTRFVRFLPPQAS